MLFRIISEKMSYDEKKTVESDAVAVNNMGGHSQNSASGNIVEKRTVPLLYVQSPTSKPKNGDSGNESTPCKTLPKFATPVNVSSVTNGITTGAKLVQVQTPNQQIAYVGTLFKQLNKGKDMMPQKVLFTPVKGKEVSMARLILPRPPTIPTTQGGFQVASKKICRSFVVSQVSQKTLIKAPGELATGKIIQPNIIRQRGVDAKILTNAVLKPATVGLTGPLTIVKKPLIQNQSGDKGPLKVILVDVKEDANKSDVRNNEPTTAKSGKASPVDEKSSIEKNKSDESPVENDSGKSVETESTNVNKPTTTKSDNENFSGGESRKMTGQWEEKESASSPSQATGDRARKRKGSLLSSISGPPKKVFVGDPYENVKLFPGAEQNDPFKVIEWDSQGIGTVPNTSIKVIKNEFDMLELHESTDARVLSKIKCSNDEIYCCLACGCYGLLSEFYNENYCGVNCRDNLIAIQHSIFKKEEKETNAETNDKKKICDNIKVKTGPMPMAILMPLPSPVEESKCADKTSSPLQEQTELSSPKLNISEVINLIDDSSSPESEPSPKKPDQSKVEPPRTPKLKKTLAKEHKINRKPDVLKTLGQGPDNAKSKIKLRPRGNGKINKSSSTEDFVAQDMDMGWPDLGDENPKKKEFSSFRWSTYLAECKSSGAWVKLFNNPFPSKPNRFKVGHRLEAIDPEHQSIICLVSISQVKGHRIKLHFDGYPKDYDFWVNADSCNLFPSGFCNKLKIPLQPPPGHNIKTFDWDIYLSRHNAKGAQQSCFEHHYASNQVNLFKVDMKLEAVDRKNTYLVCVATVAAVMENRILVHFDSWDDMYDFWVDISSPYIRPVGWCEISSYQLTPPNGIKAEDFSWKKYLKDTRSVAAPEKAFVLRPPIEFKKGMKVEAVDKRAPHLVRVATISEVLPYQVKITFDGFPAHFGYWVDDDCPDLHPVGWCSRAGHPLEPPPSLDDFAISSCPTPGCIGQGYYQGTRKVTHANAKNCPYTTENLGKDPVLTDRLKWSSKPFRRNSDDISLIEDSADESENEPEELKWAWMAMKQNIHKGARREKGRDVNLNLSTSGESTMAVDEQPQPLAELPEVKQELNSGKQNECANIVVDKTCNNENKEYTLKEETNDSSVKSKNHCQSEVPTLAAGTGTSPVKDEPLSEDVDMYDMDMCDTVSAISASTSLESAITGNYVPDGKDPLYWTIHQVAKFTQPLLSSSNDRFAEEGIDGEGLMMMGKTDLLEVLGLSVSDADKICTNVNMLKLKQKAVL